MWFHDPAGDVDFYQMSLSQSESTNSHESIIFRFNFHLGGSKKLVSKIHYLPVIGKSYENVLLVCNYFNTGNWSIVVTVSE